MLNDGSEWNNMHLYVTLSIWKDIQMEKEDTFWFNMQKCVRLIASGYRLDLDKQDSYGSKHNTEFDIELNN